MVRSPRSAAPRIRFLFVDSRVRFTLRSAYASRRTPCASLRSLRPGSGRTFTSKSSPMPGPPQQRRARTFRSGPSPHFPSSLETRSDYKTLPLFDGETLRLRQPRLQRPSSCCAHSEGDNTRVPVIRVVVFIDNSEEGNRINLCRIGPFTTIGYPAVFTVALLPATDPINRSSLTVASPNVASTTT